MVPSSRSLKHGATRIAAAVGTLAALAVLLAGCGGSGPSPEDSIRERLEAAAAKTAAAPTLESSAQAEVETGNGPEPTGCVEVRVDRVKTAKVATRDYRRVCAHGPATLQVIAIGNHAWAAGPRHDWVAIGVPARLTADLVDEAKKFDRLFAAASDFHEGPGADEFDAPFSAVGAGPRTESGELHFRAVIGRGGYLTALTVSGVEGEGTTTVKDTYEAFGAPQRIAPPHPAEVASRHAPIKSKPEFEQLFELLPY